MFLIPKVGCICNGDLNGKIFNPANGILPWADMWITVKM